MKSLIRLGMLFGLGAALIFAANFNGRLVDASCYRNNAQIAIAGDQATFNQLAKMCPANNTSTSFVVMTDDGKAYKLDQNGNSQAMQAMKNGTLNPDQTGDVRASVSGTIQNDTVQVEQINAGKPRG